MIKSIYLIGSLRNEEIPKHAEALRSVGLDVFDDWFAAGPEADDYWKRYEENRGRNYREALKGYAASHVFEFDRHHLDRCDAAFLALPAGKSAHLELGYVAGSRKPTFILLDRPDRWDVMVKFATEVFFDMGEALEYFTRPEIQSGSWEASGSIVIRGDAQDAPPSLRSPIVWGAEVRGA